MIGSFETDLRQIVSKHCRKMRDRDQWEVFVLGHRCDDRRRSPWAIAGQ